MNRPGGTPRKRSATNPETEKPDATTPATQGAKTDGSQGGNRSTPAGKGPAAFVSTASGNRTTTAATDRVPTGPDADERSERGLGITRRAIALFVVLAILAISYASSLRIYLETERANATNQQSIDASQRRIDELNSELVRWDDPDFVRAQARGRLGWVQPGDVGYRAIGPDGKPYGYQIDTVGSQPRNEPPSQWWNKMWGSIRTADEPVPVPEPVNKPEPPPITISGAPPATPSATKKP